MVKVFLFVRITNPRQPRDEVVNYCATIDNVELGGLQYVAVAMDIDHIINLLAGRIF